MSRLKELIARLCPDGVEYKTIGSVSKTLSPTVKTKSKDYLEVGKYPVIDQGQKFIGGFTNLEGAFPAGEYVIFGDHTCVVKYVDFPFVQGADGVKVIVASNDVIPKYLYYCMSNIKLKAGYARHWAKMRESAIPVPPLLIQNEIIRILDTFSKLTEALTSNLATEVTARHKQYEYYHKLLLMYPKPNEVALDEKQIIIRSSNAVKWLTMGEIAEIGTGSSNTNEGLDKGTYPFYVRSQEPRWKEEYEFDETAIITAGDGVGVGKVFHYVCGKYALHQRAYRIHVVADNVLPKYLYYYMKSAFLPYIEKTMFEGSVASIRRPMLVAFPVPIPPLEEQQRIISILDRFDSFYSNIKSILPVELATRQNQYKYYCNMLLTFKKLEATV